MVMGKTGVERGIIIRVLVLQDLLTAIKKTTALHRETKQGYKYLVQSGFYSSI